MGGLFVLALIVLLAQQLEPRVSMFWFTDRNRNQSPEKSGLGKEGK